MKKDYKKLIPFVIFVLIAINIYIFSQVFSKNSDELELYMFDVGQGDAIYFKTPSGDNILVDGGPDSSIMEELSKVMPFWDKKIEMLILTHPHQDHMWGLIEVLDRYKVEKIVYTGVGYESNIYDEFIKKIDYEGSEIIIAKSGTNIQFSKDLNFKVLAPKNVNNKEINNLNNSSIIGVLDYKDFEAVLPGDAEVEEWSEILREDLDAEVLKIAHHGSSNGTTEEILNSINPGVALISLGEDNKFGHPHEAVLDLLNRFNVEIFRTDLDGTVKVTSDGDSYNIE